MGSSINIVVGPYLDIKKNKKIVEVKIKRVCPLHKNMDQKNNKFCSQCGNEVQNIDVPVDKSLTAMQLLWKKEEFEDTLQTAGESDIILPNERVPGTPKFNPEYGDVLDLTNAGEIKDSQIAWFKEKYKDQIEYLSSELETEIDVKWGVVTYWW